jgi:MraZ protein
MWVSLVATSSVKPPRFSGEYELSLDEKSRISIPAPWRRLIHGVEHGDNFYLVAAPGRKLWLFPDKYYEAVVLAEVELGANPTPDELDYARLVYGLATSITPDSAGRVVLPERARNRANLGKDIVLVGAIDRIEIYNTADWIAFSDGLLDNGTAVKERYRQSKLAGRPQPVTAGQGSQG